MKVLKYLLILIGLLVAAGLIAGLVLPKSYHLERSIEIDAPKDIIFDQISHLKKFNDWSPWAELDPDMKQEYVGTDGTVGFIAKWEGDKNVGRGEQEITAIKPNERVDMELRFFEPMEDKADTYMALSDGEKGTKVSWGMKGESPFPGNVFMALMGVQKTIKKNYDQGLAKLKTICLEEAKKPKPLKYKIQSKEVGPLTYLANRQKVDVADISSFYQQTLGAIFGKAQKAGAEMAGMPSGLFFSWEEGATEMDLAAAIPITKALKVDGLTTVELPKGPALVVDYYGDYANTTLAHDAIDEYMKANNLKQKWPVIEEYVTDPSQEKDPSKWLTRITYFVE